MASTDDLNLQEATSSQAAGFGSPIMWRRLAALKNPEVDAVLQAAEKAEDDSTGIFDMETASPSGKRKGNVIDFEATGDLLFPSTPFDESTTQRVRGTVGRNSARLYVLDDWDLVLAKNRAVRGPIAARKLSKIASLTPKGIEHFLSEYQLHLNEGGCQSWTNAFDHRMLGALALMLDFDKLDELTSLSEQRIRKLLLAHRRDERPESEWTEQMFAFEVNPTMSYHEVLLKLADMEIFWNNRVFESETTATTVLNELIRSLIRKCPKLKYDFRLSEYGGNFKLFARTLLKRWQEIERWSDKPAGKEEKEVNLKDPRIVKAIAVAAIAAAKDKTKKRKHSSACFRCGKEDHFARDCTSETTLPSFNEKKHNAALLRAKSAKKST